MTLQHDVLRELSRHGLLLQQDKLLPNVVSIITGTSLRSSWWSHPKAQSIFAILSWLAEHPDVLFTKLLRGKVTLIHRKLWPELLTMATSGQPWQRRGLSAPARRLFETAQLEGEIRASGPAVKELEIRLLLAARQVHTESGEHATILEPWKTWSARAHCKAMTSAADARDSLEEAVVQFGAPLPLLPWVHG